MCSEYEITQLIQQNSSKELEEAVDILNSQTRRLARRAKLADIRLGTLEKEKGECQITVGGWDWNKTLQERDI